MSKRDEIARIIDPYCFFSLDTYAPRYRLGIEQLQITAYRKADAILALETDERMLAAAREACGVSAEAITDDELKAAIRAAMKAAGE